MKIKPDEFRFRVCGASDLPDILALQEAAFAVLPDAQILRRNSEEMLRECLEAPNYTIGAWYGDRLAACSVLYFPHDREEELSVYLSEFSDLTPSANYKLCIVHPDFRGNSLQFHMGRMLQEYAEAQGVRLLCCTVSPENQYSIANIERLGFTRGSTIFKYGFTRHLYYRILNG